MKSLIITLVVLASGAGAFMGKELVMRHYMVSQMNDPNPAMAQDTYAELGFGENIRFECHTFDCKRINAITDDVPEDEASLLATGMGMLVIEMFKGKIEDMVDVKYPQIRNNGIKAINFITESGDHLFTLEFD